MAGGVKEVRRYYRMDRRRIALFRFLLEAYDGLAALRTLNAATGDIVLYLGASREAELDEMIEGLPEEIRLETVPCRPEEWFDD
jgi:hypothetical protein